jgi:large repetitive protein
MPLFKRAFFALTVTFASAFLAACGGGGSDEEEPDLAVTFDYGGNGMAAQLWVPTSQAPTLLGLEGHTPSCSLSGGTLPQGVAIDSDTCQLSGAPDEYGEFNFTVRLTVAGFSGSVTADGRLTVSRPAISYANQPLADTLEWRQPSVSTPSWEGYQPGPNDTVGNFRVADADLPYGLSIDPDTGVVSGTFRGFGVARFTIQATITHNGQTLDVTTSIIEPISLSPSVDYAPYDEDTVAGRVGQPYASDAPTFDDGSPMSDEYTASFTLETQSNSECDSPDALPAGLSLDSATGIVSGTPTQAFEGCLSVRYEITAPGGGSVSGLARPVVIIQP